MVKADLARTIYQTHGGISHREAKELVEMIIEQMKQSLIQGENVKLSGFGSLNVVKRRERLGRNPQTGKRIHLDGHKQVVFRPSRALRFL